MKIKDLTGKEIYLDESELPTEVMKDFIDPKRNVVLLIMGEEEREIKNEIALYNIKNHSKIKLISDGKNFIYYIVGNSYFLNLSRFEFLIFLRLHKVILSNTSKKLLHENH